MSIVPDGLLPFEDEEDEIPPDGPDPFEFE